MKPDQARIALLELELGLVEEHPMRPGRTVCLTKNCDGDTEDVRLWGGQLAYRIHTCEAPTINPEQGITQAFAQ